MSALQNISENFKRASGHFEQWYNKYEPPETGLYRLTRLDPIDWTQVDYFKERDYAPETEPFLGFYTLGVKKENGLYNIELAVIGDLHRSAERKHNLLYSMTQSFDEPLPSLCGLTRKDAEKVMDEFDCMIPLRKIAGDISETSIAAQFCHAEETYSWLDSVEGERTEFAKQLNKWGLSKRPYALHVEPA